MTPEEKIADLKANFDYVLEGKDLEIKQLGERCNQLLKDKGYLTDELSKLKETLAQTIENDEVAYETLKLHDQEEIGMLKSRVAELEDVAELNGGAEVRFADVSIDYMQSLDITLFIFCKNGYIAFNHLEHCERDFSGLKELTRGFEFDLPFAEEMEKSWNRDWMFEIKKLVGEAWYKEGARCGFESLWQKWLYRNYPELKQKFRHIPEGVPMGESFHKGKEFKTCPMAF